jgi:hypothetical protein
VYHLATWGLAGPLGGEEIDLKTITSACEGVYLGIKPESVFYSPRYYNEINALVLQLPFAAERGSD